MMNHTLPSEYGFPPIWIRISVVKWKSSEKDYPRATQEYVFTLMVIPTYVAKSEFCENDDSLK